MEVTNLFNFSSVVIEREHTVTLRVRVQAPSSPAKTKRKPLNLGLVLDRSGSMAGAKIAYVREAAKQLVNHLTRQDHLSVVIFDDRVDTVIASQPVVDKLCIKSAIDRISERGMTNLSGGWLEGVTHVEAGMSADAINRVLLLTDGLANQGVVEHERLRAIAAQFREKGITTTTLGFGADFDENLLSSMADEGGGAFYFIENPDQVPAAFGEELGELLSVVGQNLVVEFHGRPPARFLAVLNEYPMEQTTDGIRARLGDLFGDEQREIFAEMLIPCLRELGPQEVGSIVVTLDQVVDPVQRHRVERPLKINVVQPEQAQTTPDPGIDQAVKLLRVSDIRDRVIPLINRDDFDAAERAITEAVQALEAKGPIPAHVQQEIERLRKELADAKFATEFGSKGMYYQRYRQRRSKGDYRS